MVPTSLRSTGNDQRALRITHRFKITLCSNYWTCRLKKKNKQTNLAITTSALQTSILKCGLLCHVKSHAQIYHQTKLTFTVYPAPYLTSKKSHYRAELEMHYTLICSIVASSLEKVEMWKIHSWDVCRWPAMPTLVAVASSGDKSKTLGDVERRRAMQTDKL